MGGYGTCCFALVSFTAETVAFIRRLFTTAQTKFNLDQTTGVQINCQWNQGHSSLGKTAGQSVDLAPVQEQAARTAGIVIKLVAEFVWLDVNIAQDHLVIFHCRKPGAQIHLAIADRFHLSAEQFHPGLYFFHDEIFIPRFAVDYFQPPFA